MSAQVIDFPGLSAPEFIAGFEDMPAVMSPKTLSKQIEVSLTTLTRWRRDNMGPAYFEPRGLNMVRYSRADVVEWLVSSKKPGAGTPGQNRNA